MARRRGATFEIPGTRRGVAKTPAQSKGNGYGKPHRDDTLAAVRKNNIAVIGAGMNIMEATRPAILERKGTRIGFLGYLSIVFPGLVADEVTPGCAPLRASHYYRQTDFQPGTPPRIVTELFPEDREAMEQSIREFLSLKHSLDIKAKELILALFR